MKKRIIILSFALLAVLMSACNNNQKPVPQPKVSTTVTSIEVTYSNQGFLVETQMVVKGNTVWGISKQVYGTGTMWRDIVAKNTFLNDPTRLYYNSEKGMWVVRIYPGEVLNIGGQQVNPTYTYKETTTITTTEPATPAATPASSSSMPGWIIIAIIAAVALLGFAALIRKRSMFIDIRDGIDNATRLAIDKSTNAFNLKALEIISSGAKRGQLENFKFSTDHMNMQATYNKEAKFDDDKKTKKGKGKGKKDKKNKGDKQPEKGAE
jgi:hypothetical protein